MSLSILMHDVIDSPMARREKTVTAGATGYISLQSLTPEKPKGTFLPPVLTLRRSPHLVAKQLAIPSASTSGPSVSTPVREALRKSAAPAVTVFSLLAIGESMTSCIKIENDVRMCDKNSNRATVGIIFNFNPLRGSFPLLLSPACLRHYALLVVYVWLLSKYIIRKEICA